MNGAKQLNNGVMLHGSLASLHRNTSGRTSRGYGSITADDHFVTPDQIRLNLSN